MLVWKKETAIKSDIVITQSDINEIQKAKAAIRAGCHLLMNEKGINERDMGMLIVAGAFGQYINKQSAQMIGLLPDLPLDKIKNVGNAAGTGAKLALISLRDREKAEGIVRKARCYELAANPHFAEEFANSMFFSKH